MVIETGKPIAVAARDLGWGRDAARHLSPLA
ncbi:hypothetical protein [Planosporangium flavigriseum]